MFAALFMVFLFLFVAVVLAGILWDLIKAVFELHKDDD